MKHCFRIITQIFILLILSVGVYAQNKGGDFDKTLRARDTLITDELLKYRDTLVPLLDVSYHEWSQVAFAGFHKNKTEFDRYLRISNDTKNTWNTLDLEGLKLFWYLDGDTIRNNRSYGDYVVIDTLLDVNGNVEANYYFLGQDSLGHTNIYNGGQGVDGWVLTYSGDTAVWYPLAEGDSNTARNVGVDGYGVFQDSLGSELQFRNVASVDTFINLMLADSTIYFSWDGSGRRLTAGVGLQGGGDLGADRTINFNTFVLPTFSGTIDPLADWIPLYDASTGINYKVHPSFATESGANLSLFTNDTYRESNTDTLNLVEGTMMNIVYTGDGRIVFNASAAVPNYTHIPDAYIAYNSNLYTYDISASTALRVMNAPTAAWTRDISFGEGNYIFTASGTTLYRYDIVNDTTESVNVSLNNINHLLNASDGIYAICNGRAWHIDKNTLVVTDYGSTLTNGTIVGVKEITATEDNFIIMWETNNDRWHFKKIKSDYSGFDDDDWDMRCAGDANVLVRNTFTDVTIPVALDVDNVSYLYEYFAALVVGDCSRYGYYTYRVPSGHIFSTEDDDLIYTYEISNTKNGSTMPTSYSITEAGNYDQAITDGGVYVAVDDVPYGNDYQYEQAVSMRANDIHVQYVNTGGAEYVTNVISGGFRTSGLNSIGIVSFHDQTQAAKTFNTADVYEVDYSLTQATLVYSPVTFVYFDSGYTGNGSPIEAQNNSFIDLYVDSVLKEENIIKLNVISGDNVFATYEGDGGVKVSAFADGCNQDIQTLSTTSDTLNVADGVHGYLDISGNTTIRIEPTVGCNTGNITVLCDAAGYTLTFVSDYTEMVMPCLEATSKVITTSAGAGVTDVYSYYFDGANLFINGTKNYE